MLALCLVLFGCHTSGFVDSSLVLLSECVVSNLLVSLVMLFWVDLLLIPFPDFE